MLIPKPLHVLVDPFFDSDKTNSGLLYIPDSAKGRSDQGIVKYIGTQVTYVQPGDYVLFNGWNGETITFPDEGHLIDLHEKQVVAIITSAEFDKILVPGLFFRNRAKEDNEFNDYWEYYNIELTTALNLIKECIQENTNIQTYEQSDRHLFRDMSYDEMAKLKYKKELTKDDV